VSRTICTQVINIVGDQNNNPLFFDYFPGQVELVAETPDDLKDLAKKDPPRVANVGCSLIGVGFTDQAFSVDNTEGYCTKIIRTWQVIDWCRAPDASIQLDSQQTILVFDSEAPEVTVNTNISVPQPTAPDVSELTADATDNVISNPKFLDWVVELRAFPGQTLISTSTLGFDDFRNSTAVANLGTLTTGEYEVHWIVSDKCNNVDTTVQRLTVTNAVAEENSVNVEGEVASAFGDMMDNVDVFLSTQEATYGDAISTLTDEIGNYAFANMPMGGTYFVDPQKTDDVLNGVTTLDIILIQQHVLGLKEIDNPYLKYAADVNNDSRISSLDLVDLRRLILGYTVEFPSKDSWSFIHDEQDVADAVQFGLPLEEAYYINDLQQDMNIRFVGVKTGDVSGDAVAHSTQLASGRSVAQAKWKYNTTTIDGLTRVDVIAGEDASIDGFQSTLTWASTGSYKELLPGALSITRDHYNADNADMGTLPVAFNTKETLQLEKGDILFTLVFEADNHLTLSTDNTVMQSQLYASDKVASLSIEPLKAIETSQIAVLQNTPNPWSETTEITADLPESGEVTLRVFDVSQKVIYQTSQWVERGVATFKIGHDELSTSGLYFYEVEIGGHIARQKMIKVN